MSVITNEVALRMADAGSLPEFMRVDDELPLDLSGCPKIFRLPTHCHIEAGIDLGGVFVNFHEVTVDQAIPDTLLLLLQGKRLGDIVDHRLIRNHWFADAEIVRAATKGGQTCLLVDRMFGHFSDDVDEHELSIAISDFEDMWESGS